MSISLRGIEKSFGSYHAVERLDLDIQEGEFFVLLGPSGCGKTTTLRMLAGLESPTVGSINISGRDVTSLEPRRRNVAMVFQDYGLYPHLKVRDNIAFPLRIGGVSKAERYEKVDDVADRLHIAQLLDRRPPQLSGGERQRVSLARALIRNPAVFLMDEPLSNLDAKLRIIMRSEIKRLVRDVGVTTVYVTHDQMEAMALATRIGVMSKGKMVQIGTPSEIYDRPATKFVAQFIGSPPMNVFNATLDENGRIVSTPRLISNLVTTERQMSLKGKIGLDRKLIIGVRPEEIRLTKVSAPDQQAAKVELIEPLGQDTYVYLSSDGVEFIAVTRRSNIKEGDFVSLDIDPDKIHVLEPD